MVHLSLVIGTMVFVVCFKLLDVVPQVRAVATATRQALSIIRVESLTDEAKEAAIQKAAREMAGSVIMILGRLTLCLLVPVAVVWLGVHSGAYTAANALAVASDWTFVITVSVGMIVVLMVLR
jgi:hypothetical protein